jgi:hypothetical protein
MTARCDYGPDDTQALPRAATMQIISVGHEGRQPTSGDESMTREVP